MKKATIFACLMLLSLSCSRAVRPALDAQDEYLRAKDYFEKKEYSRAAEGFQRVIFTNPGSEYADDAQFFLAKCYFNQEDYLQAALEFEFLIRNFAHSPYQEESALLQAISFYERSPPYNRDQTLTKKAIELLEDFLRAYPNTKFESEARKSLLACREKLARKDLENGKLYLKTKEFAAADIYFRSVIDNYPETRWAREAKFYLGESFFRRKRYDEAKEFYNELIDDNDLWQKKAKERLSEIEKG